jgi:hypothetical protein
MKEGNDGSEVDGSDAGNARVGRDLPFQPLLDEFGISIMGTVGTKIAWIVC